MVRQIENYNKLPIVVAYYGINIPKTDWLLYF